MLFVKNCAQVNSYMSSQNREHVKTWDPVWWRLEISCPFSLWFKRPEVEAQLCRYPFESAKPRLPTTDNQIPAPLSQQLVLPSSWFLWICHCWAIQTVIPGLKRQPLPNGPMDQSFLPHVSVQVPPTVSSWRMDREVKEPSQLYAYVILYMCIHALL